MPDVFEKQETSEKKKGEKSSEKSEDQIHVIPHCCSVAQLCLTLCNPM